MPESRRPTSKRRNPGLHIAVLALLYVLFGILGLQLAVPPGYATLIWPASGLALAGILFAGARMWPGILIGSTCVNALNSGAVGFSGVDGTGLVIAVLIAAGSTAQALFAGWLIRRFFGIPVQLSNARALAAFTIAAGPLPCVVAATVGITTLYGFGIIPATAIVQNWATWWTGDVIGVFTVLPLALLSTFRTWDLVWRGRALAKLPAASLLALALPLAATFYAWKLTSEITFAKNQASFERLAADSEHALLHRLDTYKQSLDAGAGLYQASEAITADEWRSFVNAMEIDKNLKGINGLGVIEPLKRDGMPEFLQRAAADGVPSMKIRPSTSAEDLFVIKYIEPRALNEAAVGLDIAFEANRFTAAVTSRDSGEPTITGRILLVQDAKSRPGFLLLRPSYRKGAPIATLDQRRAAFVRWIYAPFIGDKFMADLTSGQGVDVELEVFDGTSTDPAQLIYSSDETHPSHDLPSAFSIVKTLRVLQRDWTIVWHATPAFAAAATSQASKFVLLGGLAITLLFGVLLYSFARRDEEVQRLVTVKTREIDARARENRAVFDTAVVGLLVLDGDGTIVSSNKAAHAIFEFEDQAMNGVAIARVFDRGIDVSDEGAIVLPADGEAMAVRHATTQLGNDIIVSLQQNDWSTGDGHKRHTLIIREITNERRIAAALEESEKRWNYALEGAELGVFDIDLSTGKSFVSDTWKSMLGFDLDSKIDSQKEWRDRVLPADLERIALADAACVEGRAERSEAEYRIRHVDGRWLWHRSDAVIIERDADGAALRMIGVQTDVTELKNAEAALKSSEERFRSAIDNAPVGMALIDIHGEWLQLNESLCGMVGYSADEIRAIHPGALFHGEDRAPIGELLGNLSNVAHVQPQAEVRLVHKNGHSIWCLFSMSVVRGQDLAEAETYAILQFQDITERKAVERLKSEFVATVSHELRTPLTSIRGSLGLVIGSKADTLPPAVANLLRIALSNSERLILLINDILDMEKITSGMMDFETGRHRIGDLVERTICANTPIFERNALSVDVSCQVTGCEVDVDESRFQQVLTNLLSNAAKFCRESGAIQVRIETIDNRVRVSVEDDGPGVPSEFRSRIFQRFSQADGSSTRAKGGTGLGLNISKTLIEKMGGRIGFYNAPSGGAVFWFDLAICKVDAGTVPPAADERVEGLVAAV